jgi:membrane fusion protein (multidrug efflux system)
LQQVDTIYVDLTQSSVQGLQLRRDVANGQLEVGGPGQAKVTLILEDGSPYPLPGALQFTDITVNQGTGSVTVRATFRNPKMVLLPGMFVRARIEEGVAQGVFLVPQVGVTHDPQGQATALVVGPDGKAAARTLQLRGTHGDAWIVDGGLQDGDRVIVGGLQKVKAGCRGAGERGARVVGAGRRRQVSAQPCRGSSSERPMLRDRHRAARHARGRPVDRVDCRSSSTRTIAPPSNPDLGNYVGASAETATDTVVQVIEQQMNGSTT